MKRSVVLLSCIVLAGCNATTGRPAATVTAAADDDATCRSYGAVRGSPAYVQCRTSLAEGQANRSQAHAENCRLQGAGEMQTMSANGVLLNTGPREVPGC